MGFGSNFKINECFHKVATYMRIGGEGGDYPLLRVQKKVTGQPFLED